MALNSHSLDPKRRDIQLPTHTSAAHEKVPICKSQSQKKTKRGGSVIYNILHSPDPTRKRK